MTRVVLAMSGGVDSSVAAHLLREAGHDLVGVFMRHGEESAAACSTGDAPGGANAPGGGDAPLPVLSGRADHKQGCCSASDAADARRVADRLGIPFYALNLKRDFRRIVDYFVDSYARGQTPNPCVQCNHWIKFGRLFDYADSVDADFVATGHYARIERTGSGSPRLLRGHDDAKDQSYALFGIGRERLERILLPVGDFAKTEIRRRAAGLGLAVAEKRDSQEICFVTSGRHHEFVRSRRGGVTTAGEIVTTTGRVVGKHDGIERFTVGQRKGIGVAMGEPHFVVRIEPDTARVVIGPRPALLRTGLIAGDANWLVPPPDAPLRGGVQIRYNSRSVAATITPEGATRFRVTFDEPQAGIAPGQAAVVYRDQQVLGGGWIEAAVE